MSLLAPLLLPHDVVPDDNCLVVNDYSPDNVNQQWMTSGDRLMNRQDPNRVLDLAKEEPEEGEEQWGPGGRICAWNSHGGQNQQWQFEYL